MTSRNLKNSMKAQLQNNKWLDFLPAIAALGQKAIGPLFSFLKREPLLRHRAAYALGQIIASMQNEFPENARNIVRQFMWHMNEDSGNIGWGIPEAFAETLAASPELAHEYGNILISYIMDLGHADNYCDHAPLRRSCFWAVGRLAQKYPALVEKKHEWLFNGLEDEDEICRGMAAWCLTLLPPDKHDRQALEKVRATGEDFTCELFDGARIIEESVKSLAQRALQRLD